MKRSVLNFLMGDWCQIILNLPAGGWGASASACADLTNQLQCCWVDPACAWIKHWHSNCRLPVDGGGGTPRPVLAVNLCKKVWGAWLASSYCMGFQNFVVSNKIHNYKKNEFAMPCNIWTEFEFTDIHTSYRTTVKPWVAARAVRWSGIPNVARSRLTQCSKSCDLQPSSHCSVQNVELGGYCPVLGGGATSQLDLPSLTPLSVAGCGWLRLELPIGLLQ